MRDGVVDGVRRFWDARGQENAAFYVDTSLDYAAPDMVRFFEVGDVVVREALEEGAAQPVERRLAVEIGCGLGRVCKALATRFDRVIGIDIAPSMVEQARVAVLDGHVEFRCGDGHSLAGIEDASVDFLLTFTVFQHQPDKKLIADYLREAGRVLAPGGVIAAQWNNIPEARFRRMKLKWRLSWRLRRVPVIGHRTGLRDEDGRRLSPQFLGTTATRQFMIDALERAGLEVSGTKGHDTLFAWIWAQCPGA